MYIREVMVDEFWEVWLCVFEFIYFVIYEIIESGNIVKDREKGSGCNRICIQPQRIANRI